MLRRSAAQNSFKPPSPRFLTIWNTLRAAFALWILVAGIVVAQEKAPSKPLPPFRADPELPAEIVVNPGQGLGQCHWLASKLLASPEVSWAYDATPQVSGWSTIEPVSGSFQWEAMDAAIGKVRQLGKRIWLELLTTEGLTPQWARDAGVVLVGSRGGTPLPWNATYQRLLRRAVHAMADRYDQDPSVDAVNIMAGGCYGEMTICASSTDKADWEAAGYTDERFVEAVKQIIDIYLEDDYVWDDGTHSHGFRDTPVVLQLGSGLYGHTSIVIKPVVEYAMARYGCRVWLKFNGFGNPTDASWVFTQYNDLTRVGYEPAGNSLDFLNKPREYIQAALEQHASFLCLQEPYFNITDPKWQGARELAARYLGTHIVLKGFSGPNVATAGQVYSFNLDWVNRGTTPLTRPERQGVRAVPASYEIAVALVDRSYGLTAFEHRFVPDVPTTQWYAAERVSISKDLAIPISVPAGEYDVRVSLVNPNLSRGDEREAFRLVNVDLDDGDGRYTVGRIRVLNDAQPTPTVSPTPEIGPSPTATPTPPNGTPAVSWLDRLVSSLRDWIRRLLRMFR